METLFDDCAEGLPVESCGEEENAIRERTRRQVPYKKRNAPLRKKFKPNPRESIADEELIFPDQVRRLSELVAKDPKLCIETKQQQEQEVHRSQPEDPERANVTLEQLISAHTRLLGHVHVAQQLFDQQQMDVKGAIVALKSGTASLSTINCNLETLLLGEAGTFALHKGLDGAKRTFPACRNADNCVFKRDWNTKRKAPGRSWMSEAEFERFLSVGELPPQRICILCHRSVVEDIVCAVNSADGTVKIDTEDTLLQQYANLMECPGGYRSEYMQLHPADDGVYRGIFGPLVSYQKQHLAAYYDSQQINAETGEPALMLNQDKIIWRPLQSNVLPELGESSQDFQSGAARPPLLLLTHSTSGSMC